MENGYKNKESGKSKPRAGVIIASICGGIIVLGGGCFGCLNCMNGLGWLTDGSESSHIESTEQVIDNSAEPSFPEISSSIIDESRSIFDEIITSDDLPQYYGSYKEAQEFSKRFDKGVVSTDSYSFDSNVTVLSINGYWRDDEINSIEVYFKNADVTPDYDEAQEILNKFLPPDIISKYYDAPTVDLYTPNDKTECSVITVCYPLNEEGKAVGDLNGQLGMVYNIKDDVCLSACIRFGVPWRGFDNYTHQVLESPSDISAESSTSTVIESVPVESNSSAPVGNDNNSENHFNDYDTPEQQNTTQIVLNTATKKYHYPHCSEVKKIKPENCATIESEAEAIAQGYTACKKCH